MAVKPSIQQTSILKWNNWGAKYGHLRRLGIMFLSDGENLLSSLDILWNSVSVAWLNS